MADRCAFFEPHSCSSPCTISATDCLTAADAFAIAAADAFAIAAANAVSDVEHCAD